MLVFLPQYREFRILKIQVLEKELELSRREEYLSQLSFLSNKLENHLPELAKIDSALPQEPNLPSVFEFLQETCSQNGLVFKEVGVFSTNIAKKLTNIKETTIEFQVSGTIESFMNFLKILEKSARLIEVSNVSFEQPEQGDIFLFNITIKVYSQE